ncbi:MAG: dethiobiotin synthase [Pirellulales bacterium]|nr:dethiobiotin synthase [Pirellulales bacterium]
MARGLFITGTSTGVGKTYVGALIARALVRADHQVGVYKPAESGCRRDGEDLIAEDAQWLWQAAGQPGELRYACPQRFEAPLAPPQAAKLEGKTVDSALLRSGLRYWRDCSDIVLVEGAGGLMSPLSSDDYNLDLAKDLGLPLIIVAVNELGTINATLQTLITARTLAPELPIAGVVLNQTQESPNDPSVKTNAAELQARCDVPLLATLDYRQDELKGNVDWFAL